MTTIKRKSWILRQLTTPTQWITIHPNIYAADEYFRDPESSRWIPLILHEEEHLLRQKELGLFVWLARYATDKEFRLDEEARGIAVEVANSAPSMRRAVIRFYSQALAGELYRQTAPDPETAERAILDRLQILGVNL